MKTSHAKINSSLPRVAILAIATLSLLLGYSNCGLPYYAKEGGAFGLASNRTVCETDLIAAYEATYRPLITKNCASCHNDAGVAPLKLASADSGVSFNSFMQASEALVRANALNAGHASGRTGPQLQPEVTTARNAWTPAYDAYNTCLAAGGGGGGTASALDLAEKNTPALYFSNNQAVTLTWELDSEEVTPYSNRFAGQFAMDVQVRYETIDGVQQPFGYIFTRPRIQMATGEIEVLIEGIVVRVNGAKATGLEPFWSAKQIARRIDPVVYYDGSLTAPLPRLLNSDRISVSFGYMTIRPRTDALLIPPAPTLAITTPYIRGTVVGVSIGNDAVSGNPVRRWCLTTVATRPSSTAVACPGYETALTNGWRTSRPTSLNLTELGTVPPSGTTANLYLWVANADLKIQSSTVSASFTIDTKIPSAPQLASASASDTQVATLNGLTDSDEVVRWCVKESGVRMDLDSANGCTFNDAKPVYAGLAGQGTRYMRVYIQDRAGNANMSNVITTSNPFPRISFTALTGSGAQGVFTTSCASCHGAGQSQEARWRSTDYSDSVAKKNSIFTKISASGTPHFNYVDAKQRELLRLWIFQTSTPVQ